MNDNVFFSYFLFIMKCLLLFIFLFATLPPAHAQTYFEVDGKKEPAASFERHYSFYFDCGNRIILSLMDSTHSYENKRHTIIKECIFGLRPQTKQTRISYLDKNKRLYKYKYFVNDTLVSFSEKKYDLSGRMILTTEQNLRTHTTERRQYSYKDSLAPGNKKWIIENRTEGRAGGNQDTYVLRYRTDIEKAPAPDTMAYKSNPCDEIRPYDFSETNYKNIRQLATQLLVDNSKKLDEKTCKNFILTLVSRDHQQTRLSLIHRQPYWCEGQRVYFSTKTTF